MGRKRSRAALTAAWKRLLPVASFWRANSTMRIAFFAASPTRTISPTCTSTLLSQPVTQIPNIADRMHMGTMSTMASGSIQLSYCAASTRNTNKTASANTAMPISPAAFCW